MHAHFRDFSIRAEHPVVIMLRETLLFSFNVESCVFPFSSTTFCSLLHFYIMCAFDLPLSFAFSYCFISVQVNESKEYENPNDRICQGKIDSIHNGVIPSDNIQTTYNYVYIYFRPTFLLHKNDGLDLLHFAKHLVCP